MNCSSLGNLHISITGNFSRPLVEFFENEGYRVIILNPLQTHQQKKKSIRKIKTDPIDANRIAQVYYLSDFKLRNKLDNSLIDLRNLCRQYDGFNTLYTEAQLRFRSTLDLVFPNYDKVFSHLCCKTSLNVISNFPSSKQLVAFAGGL
ncbi:IS110 family transposase [Desulfuribacillus alkaliarsenatis]|uniref:IS110 family transposase n=1 Tax=Desulfuribacillus alkaliarsenatis TaxID=766136 RepID=UPI0009FD508E